MPGPGKQVCCLGLLQVIAFLPQSRHVPRQRGGVAGDVDQAGGGHLGDGVHDLRGDALAGRVHADDVRPQPPAGQDQGDGPDAAVEVQDRLRPGELGEV